MYGLIDFQNPFKHFNRPFSRTVYLNEESRTPHIGLLENAFVCRHPLAAREFGTPRCALGTEDRDNPCAHEKYLACALRANFDTTRCCPPIIMGTF